MIALGTLHSDDAAAEHSKHVGVVSDFSHHGESSDDVAAEHSKHIGNLSSVDVAAEHGCK